MGVHVLRRLIGQSRYSGFSKYRLQLSKESEEYFSIAFTRLHMILAVMSTALSGFHLYTNNWVASNLIALAFSFNAISLLCIDSFKTGTILLSGLFLYDIYWVFFSTKQFGQSVMVRRFPRICLHGRIGQPLMTGTH